MLSFVPNGPKVYFPKFSIVMVRSRYLKPNQAAFRVPPFVNKYDIHQYVERIYSASVLKIRTFHFPAKHSTENGIPTRTRAWKKAIIDLDHNFSYPEYVPPAGAPARDISRRGRRRQTAEHAELSGSGK